VSKGPKAYDAEIDVSMLNECFRFYCGRFMICSNSKTAVYSIDTSNNPTAPDYFLRQLLIFFSLPASDHDYFLAVRLRSRCQEFGSPEFLRHFETCRQLHSDDAAKRFTNFVPSGDRTQYWKQITVTTSKYFDSMKKTARGMRGDACAAGLVNVLSGVLAIGVTAPLWCAQQLGVNT
jgi:hypothetical protein